MQRLMTWAPRLAIAVLAGCATTSSDDPQQLAAHYQSVITSPVRTDQDRRMDASRRPEAFLPFTRVRPGMRVLDVSAGAGYTSQLLALAVGETGKVWAQTTAPRAALNERLSAAPQPHFVPVVRPFEDPVPEGATGLDLVTLVLNYHDIAYLPVDRAKMNAKIYAALKPGGTLVLIDHAARSGTGAADAKSLHRIDEALVRAEVERAGLRFDAAADYLRNPQDARDQTTAGAKFQSDKFVLRFVKPG